MDDLISRQMAIDAVLKLTYADGAYGYTDAKELVDSLEAIPSAQPERKTGRMSNKDWIDFLCEQFDISRTSARDMLHGMMKCKKEDNFKRIFNPMQKEGEG